MPRIAVLPDIVANRIAAGEIVERPASAVKELMENAIDAGARRIDVEMQAGGKSLVRVRDDGEGMDRDDALLAFEHHATSKLRTADDLETVQTLGFRGEALPSIASVSRLSLKTAPRDAGGGPGTLVEIEGGRFLDVRELAWAGGTEITVRDLFYNVPARRKFLRTDATESAHTIRLVTHYALARPGVYVTLAHNGRPVLDAPPVGSRDERVLQVFGNEFHRDMLPVLSERADMRVWGLVSPPHRKTSSSEGQYFFINGRMVRDRVVSAALNQAYRGVIPGGTYPAAILFLDIDCGQIDVNVHPAKTEIRFRHAWQVQSFLAEALAAALGAGKSFAVVGGALGRPAGPDPFPASAEEPRPDGAEPPAGPVDPAAARVARVKDILDSPWPAPAAREAYRPPLFPRREATEAVAGVAEPSAAPAPAQAGLWAVDDGGAWKVLGQWRESFIVAASREELVVVDQHVAHERVLFEEFLEQLNRGEVARQQLLLPVHVPLTPHQAAIWDQLEARLNANGFEVARVGARDALVQAVPALAGPCEVEGLLQESLARIEDEPDTLSVADCRRRLAAGLACRAAVKINTPLTRESQQSIVSALLRAEDPTTCPHGRPVVLRLNVRDIGKAFGRG